VRRRKKANKPEIPLEATDCQAVPEGLRILARMIARTLYKESLSSETKLPSSSDQRPSIDQNTQEQENNQEL